MIVHIGNKIPKAVHDMLKDAWVKHWWIYDKLDDKWFTPEEFKANWQKYVTAYNLNRYEARSPHLGLRESLSKVEAALRSAATFQEKLERYYQFDLKRK